MNEELMSIERLKERESVRKNIMKQASLNEELIYKSRPTFEAFKDTLYSGSARFQLLKSGLTNRIKQSTTNIEKVSGMSIKNGFVRILQVRLSCSCIFSCILLRGVATIRTIRDSEDKEFEACNHENLYFQKINEI